MPWHGHGQPPVRPDIALPQTVVTTVQVLSRITSHLVLASTSLECFALTLHTCISGGYTQPFSELFLMFGLRIPLEYIVCQRAILRHRSRGRRLAYVLPLYGCIIVVSKSAPSPLGASAAMAMQWRWHDEVPADLALLRGQWLRTAGMERWHGYDFVRLDFLEPGTGRPLSRYMAVPDVRWHEVIFGITPHGQVQRDWNLDLRTRGRNVLVRECRWRGRTRGTLLHLDDNHPVSLHFGWQLRCVIWGCYVPYPIAIEE